MKKSELDFEASFVTILALVGVFFFVGGVSRAAGFLSSSLSSAVGFSDGGSFTCCCGGVFGGGGSFKCGCGDGFGGDGGDSVGAWAGIVTV